MPIPPNVWMARSAANTAASAAVTFAAAAASAASGSPTAVVQAAQYASDRAHSTWACASARGNAIAWYVPIGRPNCSRCLACATVTSTQCWPTPTHSAASSTSVRSRTSPRTASAPVASRVAGVPSSTRSPSERVPSTVATTSTTAPDSRRSTAHSSTPSAPATVTTASVTTGRSVTCTLRPVSRPCASATTVRGGWSRPTGPPGSACANATDRSPAVTAASRSPESAGSAAVVPSSGAGSRPRPHSSASRASSTSVAPAPPASSSADRPIQPIAASSRHSAGSAAGASSAIAARRSGGNFCRSHSPAALRSACCSSVTRTSTVFPSRQRVRGRPSTRSAMIPRSTSLVPASMVCPRLRSCAYGQ